MGNKFVWKNLLINGICGAIVAVVFCLLAGVQDGLAAVLIVGFIAGDLIGIVIYVLKVVKKVKQQQAQGLVPKPKSKEELALEKKKQEEWEAIRCTKLVQSFSKKDLEKLENVLQTVESFSRTHQIPLPKQAQLLAANVAQQKHTAQEGMLTKEQVKKFDQLFANFHATYSGVLMISLKTAESAMNKNLGFGVIGDVIDVAVYSVMETAQKKKAMNESQRSAYGKISALMQEFCKEAFSIANI